MVLHPVFRRFKWKEPSTKVFDIASGNRISCAPEFFLKTLGERYIILTSVLLSIPISASVIAIGFAESSKVSKKFKVF